LSPTRRDLSPKVSELPRFIRPWDVERHSTFGRHHSISSNSPRTICLSIWRWD
jgi:hypothetical protein